MNHSIIELEEVKFGTSVSDPSPNQRIVTGFSKQNGFMLIYNENTSLLHVRDQNGHQKLYPITNIKEMKPYSGPVSRETITGQQQQPPKKRTRNTAAKKQNPTVSGENPTGQINDHKRL